MKGLKINTAIHEKERSYIGVLYHNGMLFANTLPYQRLNDIIEKTDLILAEWKAVIRESVSKQSSFSEKVATIINDLYLGIENKEVTKIKLDYTGYTEKQQRVLEVVRQIPSGSTWSYKEVALTAGLPNAFRFVGSVMAHNRFPLIVPCHRVVRSDEKIGNYSGGGSSMKKTLLMREKSLKV